MSSTDHGNQTATTIWDAPFAIGYEIDNDKIVHHWMIVDRMAMMEQLGIVPPAQTA